MVSYVELLSVNESTHELVIYLYKSSIPMVVMFCSVALATFLIILPHFVINVMYFVINRPTLFTITHCPLPKAGKLPHFIITNEVMISFSKDLFLSEDNGAWGSYVSLVTTKWKIDPHFNISWTFNLIEFKKFIMHL